jgi:succinate dehydrogenase/fumarate reductase cytochrome b subunit
MSNPLSTVDKPSTRIPWRQVHYGSGLLLATFVAIHLTNHVLASLGPTVHIAYMTAARLVYRNPVVETALLAAVLLQITTGLGLVRSVAHQNRTTWSRLHTGSGLYLAIFLLVHVSVVMAGRFVLHLDTNLYFGAAGLNRYPYQLFFIPYYSLAILSFFSHVAAIHYLKMKRNLLMITPSGQARCIIVVGGLVTLGVLYGMTNHFNGLAIPRAYTILTP